MEGFAANFMVLFVVLATATANLSEEQAKNIVKAHNDRRSLKKLPDLVSSQHVSLQTY
jgi:hypothetical protein